MKSYKGFDQNLTCRNNFQFEEGKKFTEKGEIHLCKKGFHSCPYPLAALGYYSPDTSIYYTVEADGEIETDSNDMEKICSSELTVKEKIDIPEMVKASADFIQSYATSINQPEKTASFIFETEHGKIAHSIKDKSMAFSANQKEGIAISQGSYSIASTTAYGGTAMATNYASGAIGEGTASTAITKGAASVALTEDCNSIAIVTNCESAAITKDSNSMAITRECDSKAVTEGRDSIALGAATPIYSCATHTEVKGEGSIAIGWSKTKNFAKGVLGSFLVLRDIYSTKPAVMIYIDGEQYKPDTWYTYRNGVVIESK